MPTTQRITPDAELELLITCTHRQLTPERRACAARRLAAGPDRQRLYELAQRHDLKLLLYRGLVQIDALTPLRAQLEREITEAAVLYEFVYPQQLTRLLAELDAAGIPTLILKGYALGQFIYEQPALRPYSDFDILIPLDSIDGAVRALTNLGYSPDRSRDYPPDYHLHNHHLVPLIHPEWLPVELHWRLISSPGARHIPVQTVWEQARPIELGGTPTHLLDHDHLLVYLALHAVGSHLLNMGLKALCDVQEVIAACDINWDKIITLCRAWKCARQVYVMLRITSEFYDAAVPAEVMQGLSAQDIAPDYLQYCLTNVLSTAVGGLRRSSGLAEAWQSAAGARRWQQVLSRLFPAPAEIAAAFGLPDDDWKRWLYYPRWQATLVRRHLATGLSLLRSDPATLERARQEAIRRELVKWMAEEQNSP